jgi:hypothetical protein
MLEIGLWAVALPQFLEVFETPQSSLRAALPFLSRTVRMWQWRQVGKRARELTEKRKR